VNYKLSALAKADLRNIYMFSLSEFGEAISDNYLESLYAVFETLARHPGIGLTPDFETDKAVRKFPALKHVIYYCIAPAGIEIRRLFHGSREIDEFDIRPFE